MTVGTCFVVTIKLVVTNIHMLRIIELLTVYALYPIGMAAIGKGLLTVMKKPMVGDIFTYNRQRAAKCRFCNGEAKKASSPAFAGKR